MSDIQSARLLIKTVGDRLSETTKELIHQTLKPLTRQGVTDYLKEYELRNGGFSTAATREANHTYASSSVASQSLSKTGRVKCTREKCVGVHHTPDECFSNPINAKKREAWIAKKEAERQRYSNHSKAQPISGMKELTAPAASVAEINSEYLSFNSEFVKTVEDHIKISESQLLLTETEESVNSEVVGCPSIYESEASVSTLTAPDKELWGLLDTGATHYMFKTKELFEQKSLTSVESSNNKLKMAGGESKLTVMSKGTVKLQAGDGSPF